MDDLKKVIKTKKVLEDTPYKDLGEKLSELGVPEVFEKGAKKEELIQLALQKLEEIGKFQGSDLQDQVLEDEVSEDDSLENEVSGDDSLVNEASPVEVSEYVFTKAEVEESILINESNLRQCTDYLRKILLKKQQELSDLLETFN